MKKLKSLWQHIWHGDDGFVYAVITEPSPFRIAESKLHGPFIRRKAMKLAHKFIADEPYACVRIYKTTPGATWPPKTTWVE